MDVRTLILSVHVRIEKRVVNIAQFKLRMTNGREDIENRLNISHSNTEVFFLMLTPDTDGFRLCSCARFFFFFFFSSNMLDCATNMEAADSSIWLRSSSSSEICYSDSVVMR